MKIHSISLGHSIQFNGRRGGGEEGEHLTFVGIIFEQFMNFNCLSVFDFLSQSNACSTWIQIPFTLCLLLSSERAQTYYHKVSRRRHTHTKQYLSINCSMWGHKMKFNVISPKVYHTHTFHPIGVCIAPKMEIYMHTVRISGTTIIKQSLMFITARYFDSWIYGVNVLWMQMPKFSLGSFGEKTCAHKHTNAQSLGEPASKFCETMPLVFVINSFGIADGMT